MSAPLTPARLSEIRARSEAATPGPWVYGDDRNGEGNMLHPRGSKYSPVADFEFTEDADADFIAAARQDVPDLLDEVDRLTAALERRDALMDTLWHWPWCWATVGKNCTCYIADYKAAKEANHE